jgi:hypothetical protein
LVVQQVVLELVVEQALLEFMSVAVELVSVLELAQQAEQVFILEVLGLTVAEVVAVVLLLLVVLLQVTLVVQEAKAVAVVAQAQITVAVAVAALDAFLFITKEKK